jgi:hypothetical protein
MDILLITRQRNPQIKNVTQKYDILVVSTDCFKPLEKCDMISFCAADVRIGNDDHATCPVFITACRNP